MKQTELVRTILFFSERNWVPATSSNFSFKEDDNTIIISRSGVDKSVFSTSDLIAIDRKGALIGPKDSKSSAETLIHCKLYDFYPNCQSVLHTHSVYGTVLSRLHAKDGHISFSGYEVQKAFKGIDTHESETIIPIIANDQDMQRFAGELEKLLKKSSNIPGFLIEGHGLYAWGESIAEAKRVIEALEFLFECEVLTRKLS